MLSRAAKSSQFAKLLTPDAAVPTIEAAESAPAELLRKARQVNGSFTWVAPEKRAEYELKWLSQSLLGELGLSDIDNKELAEVLSGTKVIADPQRQIYPFAQNYAGDQFGNWAGQLGDGRAITLFNINGQYEVQLKGAGMTPYSRFADGKAVLRSSIREALACEYLDKLGIPTQRCLSLVTLPATFARRERIESCAVIARLSPSWVRIGTFQLHHSRGNRRELRKLAEHCINGLHLGENADSETKATYPTGNRYFHLFRDAALRNASMVAQCQAYGFLNGVLNTDNVSILGLSMDYGPFAFMDTFDSRFTPNHDDYIARYGFQNSPMVMWWNFVKLGEALGELIGAGESVDSPEFLAEGFTTSEQRTKAAELATDLIMRTGDEFQKVYETTYQDLMLQRLGIFGAAAASGAGDNAAAADTKLLEELLQTMEECEIDYNRFFRKLSTGKLDDPVQSFLPAERERKAMLSDKDAAQMVSKWFEKYRTRIEQDSMPAGERRRRMQQVNPNFLLRNSVLANVIELAERGNWDAFHAAAAMAQTPFAETWEVDEIYSQRYLREVPLSERDSQLSCSS